MSIASEYVELVKKGQEPPRFVITESGHEVNLAFINKDGGLQINDHYISAENAPLLAEWIRGVYAEPVRLKGSAISTIDIRGKLCDTCGARGTHFCLPKLTDKMLASDYFREQLLIATNRILGLKNYNLGD